MTRHEKRDERSILRRLQRRTSTRPYQHNHAGLQIGIGDDAAVWRPRQGHETILTCDWFLEGTHFLADRHTPKVIAYKCLARAVSDIAAMGGRPRYYLLSLAVPKPRTGKWLDDFLSALRAASIAMNCTIAGGDTTLRNEILISITVVGECRRGKAILRNGAKPGDTIYVTGRLGEAEYGLRLLQSSKDRQDSDKRLRKHLFPQPRLSVGQWLAKYGLATAMMDLSDGLSSDLQKLCEGSGVGARVDEQRLPCVQLDPRDQRKFDPLELALHGGDDYELLFAVAKRNIRQIPKAIAGLPLTRIGDITLEKRIVRRCEDGTIADLKNKGWDPFR